MKSTKSNVLKICLISPFPPKKGGLSTYSERNYRLLNAKKTLQVEYIALNSFIDIFQLLRLGILRPNIVRFEFNIPAYGTMTPFILIILSIYKLRLAFRLVVVFHEVKRDTATLGFIGILIYKMLGYFFDKIFVHTEEAKAILISKCGIKKDKIYVLPLGLLTQEQQDCNTDHTAEIYDFAKKKLIVYFGFIHPHKGIEYLIEAIRIIKSKYPNDYLKIQVVIAGDIRARNGIFKIFEHTDRKYKSKLVELINKYELMDAIAITGYVENDNVDTLLSRAYMFVLPYTNTEQSGVLNLVLPYRKPIIASSIGGLEETLANYGVLSKPKDSVGIAENIHELINKEDHYNNICNGYVRLINKLNPKVIMDEFIDTITKHEQ